MSYLVDVDRLVKGLMTEHLPDVLALPERDVDAIEQLPLVLWAVGEGSGVANGKTPRQGQIWPVSFSILATQTATVSAHDACRAVASRVAEAVCEHFEGFRIPGVGGVSRITDNMSLPARAATAVIDAHDLVQFNASWEVVVRPFPT